MKIIKNCFTQLRGLISVAWRILHCPISDNVAAKCIALLISDKEVPGLNLDM
jgi:hypothetical protein